MAGRNTQEVAEPFVTPDTQAARITQDVAEPFVTPDTQTARITQETVEPFVTPDTQEARLTQIVVEVWVARSDILGGLVMANQGRVEKKSERTVWIRSYEGFSPFEWGGQCMRVEDISTPGRGVNPSFRQDPRQGGVEIAGTLRGLPGLSKASLVMKETQYDSMSDLLQSCQWTIDRRTHCKNMDYWNGWEKIRRISAAAFTERGDNGSSYDEEDTESMTTMPFTGLPAVTVRRQTVTVDLTLEAAPFAVPAASFTCIDVCHGTQCASRCDGENDCVVVVGTTLVAAGASHLLVNNRGGTHGYWTDIALTALVTDNVVDVLCFGDWLLITSGGVTDPQFILSYDRGVTQTSIAGNADMAPAGGHYAQDTDALSPAHIVAVGLLGYCYYSDDGGLSWVTADAGVATTQNLRKVKIARDNPSVVYAIGASNAIIKSENGGYNWNALTGPSPADNLTALYVKDEMHLLVGNDDGELWQSDDGGITWTRQALTGDFTPAAGVTQIYDIVGAGNDVVYMIVHDTADTKQLLYRNVDGGATGRWYLEDNGDLTGRAATQMPNAIACCGVNKAIVVGGETGAPSSGFVAIAA